MNDAVVKSLMKATTLSTAYRIGYEFLNNVGIGEHYVIFKSQFRKPLNNFQNAAHLDNEIKNVDSHFTNLALKVIKNQVMPYLNFARSFSQKWKERLEADFVGLDNNTVFPFDDIQKKTSQLMEQFEGVRGDLENNELYSNVEASFIQLLKRCESLGETIENNVGDIYDFLNRRGQLKNHYLNNLLTKTIIILLWGSLARNGWAKISSFEN